MSAAWKGQLLRMGTESLEGLYTRNTFSSKTQTIFSHALKQQAQTQPLTATAINGAVASLSGIELGVSSMNTTTGPNTNSTVHWQSAFWALVAIALNSCLQESGNISEIQAKFGLLVKSSPVFCVVDTLIVWGQIIFYLTHVSPRDAIRIVAKGRGQHEPNAVEEPASLPRIVARCLLLLLAILQALKLYALRGIPWTQAFGTMYLVSYLTNALLNVLGKPQISEQDPHSDMRRGDIRPSIGKIHFLAWIAACFQIAIWTATVRTAMPDPWLTILRRRSCSWPVDVIVALGFFPILFPLSIVWCLPTWAPVIVDIVTLILPPAIVLAAFHLLIIKCLPSLYECVSNGFGCSVKVMLPTLACVITISAMVLETCFIGVFPVSVLYFTSNFYQKSLWPFYTVIENWNKFTPFGLCFLMLALAAMVSYILYRALLMGSIAQKLGTKDSGISSNIAWGCLFMFAANVSLALLYYGHVYSPEGTWKPSWTDNLGR